MTPADLEARGLRVKPLVWTKDRGGDLYSGQYEIMGPMPSGHYVWRFARGEWRIAATQSAAIAAANATWSAQVAAMIEVIE